MGASLSWYAFRGKSPETVLREFGLKNIGKNFHKTSFCGGALPTGWFLVIHGRHEFTNDEMRSLSRGCEAVACFVEEHVMFSRAAGWKDGEQIWSVSHSAEEGDSHLDVEGEPPAGFPAIRDRLMKQQQEEGEGVDFFFNIPVDLAKDVSGYSHEDRSEITFDNFVKPTFLQRVFGS